MLGMIVLDGPEADCPILPDELCYVYQHIDTMIVEAVFKQVGYALKGSQKKMKPMK